MVLPDESPSTTTHVVGLTTIYDKNDDDKKKGVKTKGIPKIFVVTTTFFSIRSLLLFLFYVDV